MIGLLYSLEDGAYDSSYYAAFGCLLTTLGGHVLLELMGEA